MVENAAKYSKMLDELAKEYPELEADAMALQDGIAGEGEPEFGGEEDESLPFDFGDEEEEDEMPMPKKGKRLPPELEDDEDEEEDLF